MNRQWFEILDNKWFITVGTYSPAELSGSVWWSLLQECWGQFLWDFQSLMDHIREQLGLDNMLQLDFHEDD